MFPADRLSFSLSTVTPLAVCTSTMRKSGYTTQIHGRRPPQAIGESSNEYQQSRCWALSPSTARSGITVMGWRGKGFGAADLLRNDKSRPRTVSLPFPVALNNIRCIANSNSTEIIVIDIHGKSCMQSRQSFPVFRIGHRTSQRSLLPRARQRDLHILAGQPCPETYLRLCIGVA